MDKVTLVEIDTIVTQAADKAAANAVAKMREFHLDDLKVLGERMDIGFESNDRRFNELETRMDGSETKMDTGFRDVNLRIDGLETMMEQVETKMDRVENALQILINEMLEDRNELKKQISELTVRVQVLEKQLAAAR